MSAHTFSDLNFHDTKFTNVNIDNEDYSNKNILIIKDALYDTDGSKNIIPKASEDYEDVTFLYLGVQQSITFEGATSPQIFKTSTAYRCVQEDGAWKWSEYELGGSAKWNTVDISRTDAETETNFKDLPNKSKAGTQYRVLSNGYYTIDYSQDTPTKSKANLGDVILCTSSEVDFTKPVYAIIPSGDDVDVQTVLISSIDTDTGNFTVKNTLGTANVTVSFFVKEVSTTDFKIYRVPFICDYYITPETSETEQSTIVCHVDALPESTREGYTATEIELLIHC